MRKKSFPRSVNKEGIFKPYQIFKSAMIFDKFYKCFGMPEQHFTYA